MPDESDRDAALDELPETEPHSAPIFDTGPHPEPLPGFSATGWALPGSGPTPPGPPRPAPAPVEPAATPGPYHFLKWWQLVLVVVAVWIPAAGVGLGLFSWWYSLVDKTPAVFATLVYVAVCTVAGLMLAMVRDRPLIAAFAIAVMSAVFASAVAAAPLYGHHFCQVNGHCVAGIIPY